MPARKIIAKRFAEALSALAHPERFRIVEELSCSELDVHSITELLDLPQSTVSQHLATLRSHDLVRRRREGKRAYYSLKHPWVAQWLLEGLRLLEEEWSTNKEMLKATRQARKIWESKGKDN